MSPHGHPYYGVPQTTQHIPHAVGKSFDFNKYRKDGKQSQSGANVAPHHMNGFMSPQSHPESAFFKPKLPSDRNMVQTAVSGQRAANMHG